MKTLKKSDDSPGGVATPGGVSTPGMAPPTVIGSTSLAQTEASNVPVAVHHTDAPPHAGTPTTPAAESLPP